MFGVDVEGKDTLLHVDISYLDPEFADSDAKIDTGVFIQTAYQHYKHHNFHDLISFDSKNSGVCIYHQP